MPSLEKLHQQFKDNNFTLLAIDIEEKKEVVEKVVRQFSLTYPNLLDTDGQVSSMYGVRSTPMKMLIDKNGNLAAAALGYRDWDQDEVKALIETLIKE